MVIYGHQLARMVLVVDPLDYQLGLNWWWLDWTGWPCLTFLAGSGADGTLLFIYFSFLFLPQWQSTHKLEMPHLSYISLQHLIIRLVYESLLLKKLFQSKVMNIVIKYTIDNTPKQANKRFSPTHNIIFSWQYGCLGLISSFCTSLYRIFGPFLVHLHLYAEEWVKRQGLVLRKSMQ